MNYNDEYKDALENPNYCEDCKFKDKLCSANFIQNGINRFKSMFTPKQVVDSSTSKAVTPTPTKEFLDKLKKIGKKSNYDTLNNLIQEENNKDNLNYLKAVISKLVDYEPSDISSIINDINKKLQTLTGGKRRVRKSRKRRNKRTKRTRSRKIDT